MSSSSQPVPSRPSDVQRYLSFFSSTARAIRLVWETDRRLLVAMAGLTVVAGLLPAAMAVVGQRIVDAVVAAQQGGASTTTALGWVALEGLLVATMAGVRRANDVSQNLLRAQLGHRVNLLIIDKARKLDLSQFEDAQTYDQMTQARRGASTRPLSLVRRTFGIFRNGLSLVSYGALLLSFSPVAVVLLALTALPAFFIETRFADLGFRLFTWRSPEKRMQNYLEIVVSREDYAKEVKLLGIGPMLMERYNAIFHDVFGEEATLIRKRGVWGYAISLLSTLALYGTYAWIALSAMANAITLGQMTMYLMVFKQGQGAFSGVLRDLGGMYEDNLYLDNLYQFLETEVPAWPGTATTGTIDGDGIRFEEVSFTYPGATEPALDGLTLHIPPGRKLALVGHNGSGKTTLIKLLTGLYRPSSGTIRIDGRPLQEWDRVALHARVGVIFQDFVRYQFKVGDNIGVGDLKRMDDPAQRAAAAEKGMARTFIEAMPQSYDTQLGRWFKDGRELSGGQWQKIALSRAFMREEANILVLDEPTSAMDAEAEAEIFSRVQSLAEDKLAILISHRFSTVRMADEIVVLAQGRIVEQGDHATLMEQDGQYAHLFSLQAKGYQ
ncbi:MAG: ABC transporter permease [Deltaproteobacteria bacterium]|nr:ABC transporter permease [Deltaproteobacteria bacterium]